MKALKIAVVMVLVLNGAYSLVNWMSGPEEPAKSQVAYAAPQPAAEGMDLLALTGIVKEIRGGQELERRLNEPKGVNNLDLNNDNKVDYLKVTEFGDQENKIGYSITTEPVKNEEQEVAVVTVERNQDKAEIQIIGNEQIYGAEAIYNDWAPIEKPQTETAAATGTSHRSSYFGYSPYISPFGFGYYPPFYSPFSMIATSMYMSSMMSHRSVGAVQGHNRYQQKSNKQVTNPKQGKTANKGISRSLKKPTSTQKAFQKTNSRNVRGGGFGRSTGTAAKKPAIGQRSGSSFGRSTSTNQRSGSSFGSSSRSRSSSFGGFRSSGGFGRSFGRGGK